MRQIDQQDTFGPFERVERPKPEPAGDKWVPTGRPGIERNERDGMMRNTTPTPPAEPQVYVGPYGWEQVLEHLRRHGC